MVLLRIVEINVNLLHASNALLPASGLPRVDVSAILSHLISFLCPMDYFGAVAFVDVPTQCCQQAPRQAARDMLGLSLSDSDRF